MLSGQFFWPDCLPSHILLPEWRLRHVDHSTEYAFNHVPSDGSRARRRLVCVAVDRRLGSAEVAQHHYHRSFIRRLDLYCDRAAVLPRRVAHGRRILRLQRD